MILFLNDILSLLMSPLKPLHFFLSSESSSVPLQPIAPPKTSIAPSFSTSTSPSLQVYSRCEKKAPPSLPSSIMLSPSEFPTSHFRSEERRVGKE